MKKLKSALTVILFGMLLSANASAAEWRLRFFNVDDTMQILVNNNLVGTCYYSQTCDYVLTSRMINGLNTLEIRLTNTYSGWTYGYVLTKDRTIFSQEVCGMQGIIGCANDNTTQGSVRRVIMLVTK